MFKHISNKWLLILLSLGLTLSSPMGLAQDQEGNVYDPFIDYSEFEEAGEEEADVNFFRNGRLFTAGVAVGQRTFTENMGGVYDDDVAFGLFLSYFFDLRWALQFSWMSGSHSFKVLDQKGSADISHFGIDMKYYFNTQNVTKGLAAFNPYLLGGLSFINRETKKVGTVDLANDKARGFDVGAGVEVPVGTRNDMYVGLQALYQLATFDDENTNIQVGGSPSGVYANGDLVTFSFVLGANF